MVYAPRGAGRWVVLALVNVGTFMTTLDASIVNISLPSIARTFQAPVGGSVEWVIIAYLVVIAATLLTFGRLSDLVGRRPVWGAGVVVFTLGSVLSGASSSLALLIAARAFQGLGGALLFSTRRGFASGLLSMTLATLALFSVGFMLPFYFEELRGFSAAESGLLLTPMSLAPCSWLRRATRWR